MGVEPTYAAWEAVKNVEISIDISVFDLYLTCIYCDEPSGGERGLINLSVGVGVEIGVDFRRVSWYSVYGATS